MISSNIILLLLITMISSNTIMIHYRLLILTQTEIDPVTAGFKPVQTGTLCWNKTTKMATGPTIAEELFHAICLRDYCEYVTKLHKQDILTPKEFKSSVYNQYYELNTRICYVDRRINQNHVYALFGEYSGLEPLEVKTSMLDETTKNFTWY